MLRPSIVLTIVRKEIRETLRDRRTLLMMVGLPVLVYPLLFIGLGKLQESQREAREERASTVAVWGAAPARLVDALKADRTIEPVAWAEISPDLRRRFDQGSIVPPSGTPEPPAQPERESGARPAESRPTEAGRAETEPDDLVTQAARDALLRRRADAILVLWPGLEAALQAGRMGRASMYFDSVNQNSTLARQRVGRALETFRRDVVLQRQRARGLDEGFSVALRADATNVAPRQRRTGQALGTFLPFMLIAMSLLGGLYPAIDMTAGEKERGTMQTLLCAPIGSAEIITGKFIAVWIIGLIAALANIVSLAAALGRIMPGTVTIGPSTYLLAFVMLVPVTFIVTAVFLAVAAMAKDFKDGQNFLMPVYMLLALPAGVTMVPGVQLNAWTAFVPVINIALLIKALLLHEAPPDLVFLTLVSAFTYAALAVTFAASVFEHEQLLLGGREPWRTLLGLDRRPGRLPSAAVSLVTFAVALVSAFYGSLLLQQAGTITTLVATELGFFLLPGALVVFGLGYAPRETLLVKRPALAGVIAAILLGLSSWTFATGVLMRLLPPPEEYVRALERLVLFKDQPLPLWLIWLLIGVMPAVCEELFFRGLVMSGLRRFGPAAAVGVTALLFGVAHASIYRLLPTVFLGAMLGVLAWRSGSIFASMTAHAVNNAFIATIVHERWIAEALGLGGSEMPSWRLTTFGTAIMIAGLIVLWKGTREGNHRGLLRR
ncbi:MAG: CPBP family intramembrane metalloprotease [Acidobacteria bacterium]|nr:CPBP family intramembrane metalloprotease [Acidobacteriota bacterium]